MAVWLGKLNVADLWKRGEDAPDSGPEFEEFRDSIVARIRAHSWHRDSEGVQEIVEELAEVENVREFDLVWDALYDQADSDRVWINTF